MPPAAASPPARSGPSTIRRAWAMLLLLAGLLLAVLATLPGPELPLPGAGSAATTAGIVDGMRHGDGYYTLAQGAARDLPDDALPALAIPLPTLATIAAALPAPAMAAMLWMLAGAVVLAWQPIVRHATGGGWRYGIAVAATIGGCAAALRPSLALAPELWAGLFLALSLARRRIGDPIEATAFGLAAALLALPAGIYLPLMAAMAWRDDRRREAAGWLVAGAVLTIVVFAHANALPDLAGRIDAASPDLPGWGFPGGTARLIAATTILGLLPASIGALLIALGLVGWTRWRGDLGVRAAASVIGGAAILALAASPGRGDGWPLLIAPVSLVGLAFVPDLVRDLIRTALDRRRITVRRLMR